ncbi:diguanylate cyclase (GGDEF)-like protein [Phyllobacterium sp. 1468]|uniref:putative bifunctional diguanylate cyclase/phosphodiesterase n=1 Tax=Phyllobacterium sp. 1468 TaxID=2817759 RepID=UPI00285D9A17|nr:EAL domain-containing protein [Phyllobacterium sp. 1468]MDR6636360.1 diguanylate cyclase (GGDEF)-like protein [Phyllobacterium sp. 1468]
MNLFNLFEGKARTDAFLVAATGVIVWIVALQFDVWDRLTEFLEGHEAWQLDELILGVLCVGFCGFAYSVRRLIELRSEVRRRRTAEDNASWIAMHDPLTRLPNRRFMSEFIQQLAPSTAEGKASHTAFAIDLDGFKKANDLLGHHGGDMVLIEVSDRLRRKFPSDVVARIGGDEFTILVDNQSLQSPVATAQELVGIISEPMIIEGRQVEVGASVGVATPEHVVNPEQLPEYADVALYVAKRSGRNSTKMFDPAMLEYVSGRAKMEQALRVAVRNHDIVPYFQPLIDMEDGKLVGFEALARWQRDNGEFTPPDVFIALAEQAGLIIELSESILRQACKAALEWPNHLTLAFNVSPTQLSDRRLGLRIIEILAETGLSPQRLEIEITESALVRDTEMGMAIVSDLHNAGVRIALDDFGTGFSSLSQLGKLSFDKIKIDRSFVTDCEHDPKRQKIVNAILNLGRGLGIETTAEGIETPAQYALMKQMGCDTGQGYLFSAARAVDDIPELIASFERSQIRAWGRSHSSRMRAAPFPLNPLKAT